MRVLTVCWGNICRSPTAKAALRDALAEAGLAGRVEVDSAGTGRWHIGEPPDERMCAAAERVGLHVDGSGRQITPDDLDSFDLILTMDKANHREVLALTRDDQRGKVRMLREFDPDADASDAEVPDPYYGGPRGFEEVVEIARRSARGVVVHLRRELG